MTDIREDWAEIARRMRTAPALGVLLSCDDALSTPADPHSPCNLTQECRDRLQALAALERVIVALHGSSTLSEMSAAVGVSGIWYVANRGFELRDPQGSEIHFFGPDDVRLMDRIHEDLLLETTHVAGVRLLHRGPCLALCYGEVDPPQVAVVLDIFRKVISPMMPQVVAVHGRKTIEACIRSPFDEKAALRYVHRRLVPGTLFFYFGADPVLLEMFKDFRPFDILVEVSGGQGSSAKYRLPGPAEVIDVLGRIETQWKGGSGSTSV